MVQNKQPSWYFDYKFFLVILGKFICSLACKKTHDIIHKRFKSCTFYYTKL